MGALTYTAIMSLDGFIEDSSGTFDWAEPDDEVFAFINDLERSTGVDLYGRRMYEIMSAWEDMPGLDDAPEPMRDFAGIWKTKDKIVYSRTLATASTTRTRIERDFVPEEIQQMKASRDDNISISGPDLAAHAFRAGLVDEVHLFLIPVAVGGGKSGLPVDTQLNLKLVDQRRFDSGIVYLAYRTQA